MSWELCVIGTAVSDVGSMGAAEELRPSDFTAENQKVWSEMLALHQNNALSAGALATTLLQHEVFTTEADVSEYIQKAMSYSGTTMDYYVEMVLNQSIRKSIQRVAGLINVRARDENVNSIELLEYAEHEIMKLRRHRDSGISMADLMSIFMPRLDSIRNGTFKPAWSPKLQAVRDVLKYAEESEFIIVAGRPGTGKSSYLRYEAYYHSLHGKGVVYFLIENDPMECARYFISLTTGIDSDHLKTGKLTPAQYEIVKDETRKLATSNIKIEYASNISSLKHAARKYALTGNYDLFMLDYIQLMSNGIENKNLDVSATSQGLKNLAQELKIPWIAAAQLSRDIEKRGENSDPKMSDLRDSGSLEQDANIIIFPRGVWPSDPSDEMLRIYPENVVNGRVMQNNVKAMPIQFHIAKNRNGPTGISTIVKWNKSTGQYYSQVRNENLPRSR